MLPRLKDSSEIDPRGAYLAGDRNDSETESRLGNALAGVKWRFLDEETNGVSMSIYPRVEWNMAVSSIRRGLVERGTDLILPAEIARRAGPLEFDAAAGYVVGNDAADRWTLGLISAWPINERFEIMAGLHSVLPADFGGGHRSVLSYLGLQFTF